LRQDNLTGSSHGTLLSRPIITDANVNKNSYL
jgi:hypothetical protein